MIGMSLDVCRDWGSRTCCSRITPVLLHSPTRPGAAGSSAPFRLLNTYVRPNISAAGGLSNFSLALIPHLGPPGVQPSTSAVLPPSQPPPSAADVAKLLTLDPGVTDASVDWEAVFLNGHSCSKIPSRSLLMNDCSALT
jgi:hypothetical protein